eukprot:jgi/Botrbrau1/4748/Bobra.0137s0020.1
MAQVDERDAHALEELQNKILQYRSRMKLVSQQIGAAINTQRRATLVQSELKQLPDDTRTYGAVGRAYILVPKAALEHEQQDKINITTAEVTRLKETRDKLESTVKTTETEFRELVQQVPALRQQLMR